MNKNMGKILTLFSVKGGTGKTILSLSLAGICSNLEKKILIIDLDIYGGGISLYLNKEVNKTIFNFVDDYGNHRYKDFKDYVTKYNDYIDYISAPKDPRKSNKINNEYIEILIDKAKFNYDVILIDTTHILNELNLNILDKSDNILFCLTNNSFDIKNMRNLIGIFNDLEKDNYKVLLNESININNKKYYNMYDIRDIIKNNIDYYISNKYFISDIDKYIINSQIITMVKNYINTKDYKVLENIIIDVVGDIDE